MSPRVAAIRRRSGIAGQVSVSAEVTYPDEGPRTVVFVGSVYGGPVVMLTDAGQTFVTDPDRFGETLDEEWVRRFYGIGATCPSS